MTDPRPLIPVNIQGLEELAEELLVPNQAGSTTNQKGIVLAPPYIKDPENYIGIPQYDMIISKRERHKNLEWENAIMAVHKEGKSLGGELYAPDPAGFMAHFLNVKEAALGKGILYDGRGKPIKKDEAISQWNYFSSIDRYPFNGEVCWTWLDAKFVKNSAGKLELETQHKLVSGKLEGRIFPLDSYVQEDCYVDLEFNSQGLAVKEAKAQKYQQGENIYFYAPRENTVARFYAGSNWAGLGCDLNPSFRYASLGVFLCAEGSALQNGGRK